MKNFRRFILSVVLLIREAANLETVLICRAIIFNEGGKRVVTCTGGIINIYALPASGVSVVPPVSSSRGPRFSPAFSKRRRVPTAEVL